MGRGRSTGLYVWKSTAVLAAERRVGMLRPSLKTLGATQFEKPRSLLPELLNSLFVLSQAVLIKLGRNSDLQGFHVFIFGVAGDLLGVCLALLP